MSKQTLKEIEDEIDADTRKVLGLLMMPEELEADLARLKDMDKPPVVWTMWNIKKLIWLYEQMLANSKASDTVNNTSLKERGDNI